MAFNALKQYYFLITFASGNQKAYEEGREEKNRAAITDLPVFLWYSREGPIVRH